MFCLSWFGELVYYRENCGLYLEVFVLDGVAF